MISLIKRYKELKEQGLLGINARNAEYVQLYNERKKLSLVDNKLKTKELAKNYNIHTPEVYAVIEYAAEVRELKKILHERNDFVIKPACGAGGFGILVITGQFREYYKQANNQLIKIKDIELHVSNILTGMYSLGGYADKAIIEYRIIPHEFFTKICFQGVPDLRVIVFKGIPVMAMLRLPTRFSNGKANLHQGAIGVGIDMVSGQTRNAVNKHNEVVDFHPDTFESTQGYCIPFWQDILRQSAECCEMTGLGYIGVDFSIDHIFGPLMLEVNARPGLNIQLANESGLLTRLKKVEKIKNIPKETDKKLALMTALFGTK